MHTSASLICTQAIAAVNSSIPDEMKDFLDTRTILDNMIDTVVGTAIDKGMLLWITWHDVLYCAQVWSNILSIIVANIHVQREAQRSQWYAHAESQNKTTSSLHACAAAINCPPGCQRPGIYKFHCANVELYLIKPCLDLRARPRAQLQFTLGILLWCICPLIFGVQERLSPSLCCIRHVIIPSYTSDEDRPTLFELFATVFLCLL